MLFIKKVKTKFENYLSYNVIITKSTGEIKNINNFKHVLFPMSFWQTFQKQKFIYMLSFEPTLSISMVHTFDKSIRSFICTINTHAQGPGLK